MAENSIGSQETEMSLYPRSSIGRNVLMANLDQDGSTLLQIFGHETLAVALPMLAKVRQQRYSRSDKEWHARFATALLSK